MKDFLDPRELPVYSKLQDNRAAMMEFFASTGWALWLELSEELSKGLVEHAMKNPDREAREEARTTFVAFEKFKLLPLSFAQLLNEGEGSTSDSQESNPEQSERA